VTTLTVLDVGHGNCTIVRSRGAVAVVDSPIGSLLLDTLRDLGIDRIDAAFISHSDKDHLAGIVALLTSEEVTVDRLYVNPDAGKGSAVWRDLIAAVSVAQKKGTCEISNSLTSAVPGEVTIGEARISVVAPSAALALRAVAGVMPDGAVVTANSLSAVLRVETVPGSGVLLAGDLDELGLADAVEHDADLGAKVLVFPHHGGSPGGDIDAFVKQLIARVTPETVIFSNGRTKYDLPLQAIVEAVVATGCSVACTQLARACSNDNLAADHLEDIRAHGRRLGHSCAGSVSFDLDAGALRADADIEGFMRFVDRVPTPMCRRAITSPPDDGEH
jgi:competence protein ComEC